MDTTVRLIDDGAELTSALEGGHLDVPRMREGGLTGAFFSLWVDPYEFPGERAWERVQGMAASVRRVAERHPETAALCTTAAEVRAAHASGRVVLLMGVEGGHALGTGEESVVLARLRLLHELGVRYLTITWSVDNPLGHSSSGRAPARGLTPLGRRVVREMNRLGMIVDVSHVSDRTFWDIMETTRRPVLATHSSSRALSDHPRNLTDPMIRRIAEGGGAVCINFFSVFLDAEYGERKRRLFDRHRATINSRMGRSLRAFERGPVERELLRELAPDLEHPTVQTVVEHVRHVVGVGGPDAACLGSDFDGASDMPDGLEDASRLGRLVSELESAGIPLSPVLGENLLRVLEAQSG